MSARNKDPLPQRGKSRNLRPLVRLLPALRSYRGRIVFAFLALLIAASSTLVLPVAARRIIDHGFTASDAALINQYFLVMLLVVAALAISSAVRFYYVTWLGERVVADMRDRLFSHLLALDPGFHERQRSGEIISRLTADTTQIKSAFSSTASIALRNIVMFAGAVIMMVITSPKLSGLGLLAIPLIVLPLILYGRKVRKLSRSAQDTLAMSVALAQERLQAIQTVQSNVQADFVRRSFQASTETAFEAAASRTLARAILTALIIFVATGAIVGLLWYGASEVVSGQITGGVLAQFVIYAILAASSLGQLAEVWGEVQLAAGAAERIAEIMDEAPTITRPALPVALPFPAAGTLALNTVCFSYPARPDIQVLDHISFAVSRGETVAIVGPSGAGKTTLFALLLRFFDPVSGTVQVDGIDIRTADPDAVRGRIALVPQDTVIFSGTILDNIRFGRPDATREDALTAARLARVDEFAIRFPEAWDTRVGERGVSLSGGQRQRIAIARALLREAPILLLDEATSALDAESEAYVQEALEGLMRTRTTLVIAHRLATVRRADRILVLEAGKLVAQGTHAELLKSSPLYARLAELQFTDRSI